MVLQETFDYVLLEAGQPEDIRKPSSTENDLLASTLWVMDSRIWIDLCGADASNEGAASRETGVEDAATVIWVLDESTIGESV